MPEIKLLARAKRRLIGRTVGLFVVTSCSCTSRTGFPWTAEFLGCQAALHMPCLFHRKFSSVTLDMRSLAALCLETCLGVRSGAVRVPPHGVKEGKVVSAWQVGKLRNRLIRQPAVESGLCAALPVTRGANPSWRYRLPELPGGPDTSLAAGAGWWEGRAELYASCLQLG